MQGPPAVRDSPPQAASGRNRENPAPLPTASKDRRVKCARRRVLTDRCGDCPWVCIRIPPQEVSHFTPPRRDVLWDNRRCSGGSRTRFASPSVQSFCALGQERPCEPLNEGSPMKSIRLVSTPTRNRRLNEILGMVVLVAATLLLLALASYTPTGPLVQYGGALCYGTACSQLDRDGRGLCR